MSIQLIDKIKQKNSADFKLLDYIDIHGRITGWQNPVEDVFDNIAGITGLAEGDLFIVRDVAASWPEFMGEDIYGNTVSKINNGVYYLGPPVDGEALPVYLVTPPAQGMVTFKLSNGSLIAYNNSSVRWDPISAGTGTVTGQVMRFEGQLSVEVGTNYDLGTKQLSVGTTLESGDNINIYVNGIKYTYTGALNAFTFSSDENYIVWIPGNAGFDLEDGDFIEIEIFNVE